MSTFRRSKLSLQSLRIYTHNTSVSSIRGQASKIHLVNGGGSKISASNPAMYSSTAHPYSSVSHMFRRSGDRNNNTPFSISTGARPFYKSNPSTPTYYPIPQGWWYALAALGSFGFIIYIASLETVPYTNRRHVVLMSHKAEMKLGENHFKELIEGKYAEKIRDSTDPDTVRVRSISNRIIQALKCGEVRKDDEEENDHDRVKNVEEEDKSDQLDAIFDFGADVDVDGDKKIQNAGKKEQKKAKAIRSFVDGFQWEVVVVEEPDVNALCLPGGKIVVFTGLLDHLQSDAEIATIVGHEVGHAVAQHVGEKFSKKLLIIIVKLLSEKAPKAKWLPKYLLTLPFSRKMEAEADHIGLMLMASAGYDPRAAPTVYEKLEKLSKEKSAMSKYFSSHLSRGKRYPLLTRAPVMEEAVTLYNETMAERGADRFFDNGVMAD